MRTPDKEFFLKNLDGDGTPIGNKSLRIKLNWEEEKYWRIKDELLEEGLIKKAMGKGGAVAKIIQDVENDLQANITQNEKYKTEKSLYSDFKVTVESKFAKDMSIKNFVCEDVSSQGRKATGGLWT